MDNKKVGPIRFIRDRPTKNKVLFREQTTNHIGGLYLRKETVAALGDPKGLVLSIMPATITGAELDASKEPS